MNAIKKIAGGLAVVVLLLLVVSFFLPTSYGASRSVVIDAPVEVVFDHVNTLQENEKWSPWKEADPEIQITYNEIPSGEGASYSWTSEDSGNGTLTIVESVPNRSIRTALDFMKEGTAEGTWMFVETAGGVEVTWGFRGEAGMNPLMRYMGLLMDSFVGPDFERGLALLKQVSETAAMSGGTHAETGAAEEETP